MSLIIKLIKFYQRFVSPHLGRHCRFYPTCSQYLIMSIEKHGLRGALKGLRRIFKCHPWNEGGIDYP